MISTNKIEINNDSNEYTLKFLLEKKGNKKTNPKIFEYLVKNLKYSE
jgi:hypothetical protein